MVLSKARGALLGVVAAAALAGCAQNATETDSASASQPSSSPARHTPPADPYPSTYRPYPGVPTAILPIRVCGI